MNDTLILQAFNKLRSAIYFEKDNLVLQEKFVKFYAEHNFSESNVVKYIINWIANTELVNQSLNKIDTYTLPKTFQEDPASTQGDEKNYISNRQSGKNNIVTRLMIYADFPIELHIVAVMWVLTYGVKLEEQLLPCCKANRLALNVETHDFEANKFLYKHYFKLYQNWWSKAIDEAKHILDNDSNVYILNLDIQNYYHSVAFQFNDDFFNAIEGNNQEIINTIFVEMHKRYTAKFNEKYLGKCTTEEAVRLPIGLYSSPLLANWYLKDLDKTIEDKIMPAYYGRYVDDLLLVFRTVSEAHKSVDTFIKDKLYGILTTDITFNCDGEGDDKSTKYIFEKFKQLSIQSDKITLYYFDKNYPTGLLSRFEAEQKLRSSEYRFLSDEEDNQYSNEELNCFDNCFESDYNSKKRFKPHVENKYKLSCFLAKFISRRLMKGREYGKNDEKKIKLYFKGFNLMSHYQFWEKLFAIFAISEDVPSYQKLGVEIRDEIDKIILDEESVQKEWNGYIDNGELKRMMHQLLEIAQSKTYPLFSEIKRKEVIHSCSENTDFFEKAYFIRHQFCKLSLQSDVDISQSRPYDLHLYERACSLFIELLEDNSSNGKLTDFNYNTRISELLNRQDSNYIKITDCNNDFARKCCYFIRNASKLEVSEIHIALVNRFVSSENVKQNRRGLKSQPSPSEIEQELVVLDQVEKLKECDLFVLPELSLSVEMLPVYLQWSARKQKAFVAGLEYINKNGMVFNIDITCIPVLLNNTKDCLPIFRLKNHYSPREKELLMKESFKYIDNSSQRIYNLIDWNGFRFAVYNCYELSSIRDRSIFIGEVDAVFAIAFNKDTPYFNSIVESTSRDLHCFVILNNTSQYGDSQIIAPKDSNSKFIMKIKGGTTATNPVNVMVGTIDLENLRNFQQYDDPKNEYKPLPAGYPQNTNRLNTINKTDFQ